MRALARWCRAVGVTVAVLGVGAPAGAQISTYTASLSGAEESPPTGSTGIGRFLASYDPSTFVLSIDMTFSGLVSPTTISHIHCCTPPGTNTGVSTPLPSFPGFPAGVLAGSYANSFDLSLASSFNPAFVTARGGLAEAREALLTGMATGNAYINIHTQQFPAGEIRGFITQTPEPGTYALLATGLVALGAVARRRRDA